MSLAWIDAGNGASGDMLLAALWDAGADPTAVRAAVRAAVPADVAFHRETRDGFRVTRAVVTAHAHDAAAHRTWADIERLLLDAPLSDAVRGRSLAVFRALVDAEARVHGTEPALAHLHEAGGHDAIADVVGTVAALDALGVTRLTTTTVAVGGASTSPEAAAEPGPAAGTHGRVPVPVPAVLQIAATAGVPVTSGPVAGEACTPTGMALLATLTDSWGGLPPLRAGAVGLGAGTRPTPGRLGALRVVIGSAISPTGEGASEVTLVTSTNVDDMDPRLWPRILAQLLAAGADDAWLTPVLMKKGRPAHVLTVLSRPEVADAVRRVVLAETSAIGLRVHAAAKHALDRDEVTVEVLGHRIRVKRAWFEGLVVNRQPEWEDVAVAATATGIPAKEVLALAAVAARHPVGPDGKAPLTSI